MSDGGNVVGLELVNGVGEAFVISPDSVLDCAKGRLLSVVVVGIEEDGSVYVASSGGG